MKPDRKGLGKLRRLMRFGRDASGAAAVEFAFAVPIMVALAVGGMDFGRGFQQKHRIAGAAQAAAQFAVQRDREFEEPAVADVEQRAKDDAGDPSLNVTAQYYCVCPNETTKDFTCTGTCTIPRPQSKYVEVTITDQYQSMLSPMIKWYPGLSDTITLTAVATVRVR